MKWLFISVNGKNPNEIKNILRGQWNFQTDGTKFKLNLNGTQKHQIILIRIMEVLL